MLAGASTPRGMSKPLALEKSTPSGPTGFCVAAVRRILHVEEIAQRIERVERRDVAVVRPVVGVGHAGDVISRDPGLRDRRVDAGDRAGVRVEAEVQAGVGGHADAVDRRIEVEAEIPGRQVADARDAADRAGNAGAGGDDVERRGVGARIDAEAVEQAVHRTEVDADQRLAGGQADDRNGGQGDVRRGEIEGDQVQPGQRVAMQVRHDGALGLACGITVIAGCPRGRRSASRSQLAPHGPPARPHWRNGNSTAAGPHQPAFVRRRNQLLGQGALLQP